MRMKKGEEEEEEGEEGEGDGQLQRQEEGRKEEGEGKEEEVKEGVEQAPHRATTSLPVSVDLIVGSVEAQEGMEGGNEYPQHQHQHH
jgi:hypothetical protein